MAVFNDLETTQGFNPGFTYSSFATGLAEAQVTAMGMVNEMLSVGFPPATRHDDGSYELNWPTGLRLWFKGTATDTSVRISELDLTQGDAELGMIGSAVLNDNGTGSVTAKELWLGNGTATVDYRGAISLNLDTGSMSGSVKEAYLVLDNGDAPGDASYVKLTGSVTIGSGGEMTGGTVTGYEWGTITFDLSGDHDAIFAAAGSVTGVKINAAALQDGLENDGFPALMSYALAGNDSLTGTSGGNYLDAGAGNDKVYGAAGDDTISGGDGNDQIFGDAGNDTIIGGAGNDKIVDLEGNNSIDDYDGTANITTGAGSDYIDTGSGNDKIVAGAGDNSISAGNGNNNITTGAGNDWIEAGSGNDKIVAGAGSDFVTVLGGKDNVDLGQDSDVDLMIFDTDFFYAVADANTATTAFTTVSNFNTDDDLLLFDFFDWSFTSDDVLVSSAASISDPGGYKLLLNTSTGKLYYDADGTGSGSAAIQIGLIKGTALATADESIIFDLDLLP